ncbi:MAG: nicotinate-nucleotide adenylyltransferase [Bacillota bacterium]|uniref:Probable nicotinate-nucleotide adenylyltransferase n=1 Tax=Virgibacillus salarius TaxID=447199 RepID=A0A941IDN3_9BACI|nr:MULTISPECIES: nicotinate-nucleotide adenylyltransferase [Bacillaceae]NAZ10020.1 nicotinate-nucleotide adenylyltransferase [Agaribacter marinus]MBR7797310.1 nicotinate-nucleotide adenylyltransferase [Virgibacillus salarius]MCC2250230.1 nicotinate-nucleotide adenylyltransferase [Virgibacillus sp. AGTR]MDY7044595.1 nicotinate-nucleotide adenylyltransferase [Virgibacillus sp. M23]QRZ17480.1 nicotinate-nucleotide adenylyltransferase [Virgibacillus sp. AGTR]
MKRIGILGGTFDPPHIGHLIIAEEVRISLELDEVWFIPSYTPPHKEDVKTSPNNRLEMVHLAIENNRYFKVNPVEINRVGKSYTIDTIKELKKNHPHKTFYFIIGADMVEYLPKWERIDELMQLIQFVGVKRSTHSLQTHYPIVEVDIPLIEISSTLLRERLERSETIHYLLPDSVYNYIKENHLYEN